MHPILSAVHAQLKSLAHRSLTESCYLGSTQVTGIHVIAYQRLREELGLPPVEGADL